jgi:hypothetical protein
VIRLVAALFILATAQAAAGDRRICGEPARNERGEIIRRADVLAKFQRLHPCPATGRQKGACKGWAKDHVIPLACGGCDAVENLQWLPNAIKSARGTYPKDRWERRVYCNQTVRMPE